MKKDFFNKYNYPVIATPKVVNNKQMPKQEIVQLLLDRKVNLIEKLIVGLEPGV